MHVNDLQVFAADLLGEQLEEVRAGGLAQDVGGYEVYGEGVVSLVDGCGGDVDEVLWGIISRWRDLCWETAPSFSRRSA